MKLKSILLLIGSIFIIIGITLKTKIYYHNYLINKQEIKAVTNYFNQQNNEYIAIIEIPKINLKKGIKENDNVDKGIMLLDKDKIIDNTFILAAHSGNCDICYFNQLDTIKKNDIIYFYYNHIKFTFEIFKIERKRKSTFTLQDDKDTITLITCEKNNEDYQIIMIGKLIKKERM